MFLLWRLTVSKLHIHCLKWVDGLQQPAIIAGFLPDDDRAQAVRRTGPQDTMPVRIVSTTPSDSAKRQARSHARVNWQ